MAQTIGNQKIDLILTGVQSEDLGFSSTGPMLAERLGWNHATMVTTIHHLSLEQLVVGCELDGGALEEVTLKLPAVLCFQSGINHPRYATLKGIMAAKKKEIRQWNLESPEFSGLKEWSSIGRLEVKELFQPKKKKSTVWLEGTPKEIARKLVDSLRAEAKIP
jgi:electron transfer flavoprotein beta subunit